MKPILLLTLSLLLLTSACSSTSDGPSSYPSYPSNAENPPNGQNPVQIYLPPAEPANPDNPYAPLPEDARLQTDMAYIESHELQTVSTFPPEYLLVLQGSLPTPCHALRARISPPDETNALVIEVYSVTDPNAICTQVLQPFNAEIPIRNLIPGRYKVFLNDKQIAEIDG